MAKDLTRAKRKAIFLFVFGWFLTVFNLLGVGWAIFLSFDLRTKMENLGGLFFFDEQGRYALIGSLIVLGFCVSAIFQIIFAQKWALSIMEDIPETEAAESSIRISNLTAWLCAVLCGLAFIYDIRFARDWLKLFEQSQRF